jgi:V/A-type H+-transporting ATPase subunit K
MNKRKFVLFLGLFQVLLVLLVFLTVDGLVSFVSAQGTGYESGTAMVLGIASAISVSSAVIGSAWAIKTVGTAAVSALTEREGSFGQLLVIVALAEALAVYGLIVAILIWTKIPAAPG